MHTWEARRDALLEGVCMFGGATCAVSSRGYKPVTASEARKPRERQAERACVHFFARRRAPLPRACSPWLFLFRMNS